MSSLDYESPWMTEETRIFQRTVQQFVEIEIAPHREKWAEQGHSDAQVWRGAGKTGLLLSDVPEQYGGGDGTFAFEAVVIEELARAGIHIGFGVQSIVAHYILSYGNEEQKLRWLPRMAKGEYVASIGMTEPGAGSDLQSIKTLARRDGDHYVISGSKTFITNGVNANLVCLVVRTDPKAVGPKALSVVVVETEGLAGYRVGRPLDKIGRHVQDTCELFFDNVRVPVTNLLGAGEGRGLFQMMDQLRYERVSIGLGAVTTAERAIELTTKYVKERKAFGKSLLDFQNTRFTLAECKTEARIGRIFIDNCVQNFIEGRLDSVTAAMAKYWLTDREFRIIDECVQLYGGYGYMSEFPIARMWVDCRSERIYAGSNEIMKEVIGSSL
jgi:acyl-CoA dehydrogenase